MAGTIIFMLGVLVYAQQTNNYHYVTLDLISSILGSIIYTMIRRAMR